MNNAKIYIDMLTKTERFYNRLEKLGVDKDSEYMKLLSKLMEETIKIIKTIEDNNKKS
jgi:hypothetical protein